jgi:hypothetical protein
MYIRWTLDTEWMQWEEVAVDHWFVDVRFMWVTCRHLTGSPACLSVNDSVSGEQAPPELGGEVGVWCLSVHVQYYPTGCQKSLSVLL